VIIGCLWAPFIGGFGGVFKYIQMFWGFVTPGIVAVFVMGMLWKKVPAKAAVTALLLNIPIYGLLLWLLPNVAFLHHMMITFLILVLIMYIITLASPMEQEIEFKGN